MEVNLIINTIQNRPSTRYVHVLFLETNYSVIFYRSWDIRKRERLRIHLQNKIVKVRVLISERKTEFVYFFLLCDRVGKWCLCICEGNKNSIYIFFRIRFLFFEYLGLFYHYAYWRKINITFTAIQNNFTSLI